MSISCTLNSFLLICTILLGGFLYMQSRRRYALRNLASDHQDSLFSHHPDGMIVYQNHDTVLNMNTAMQEITEYSLSELQQTPWEQLLHPKHREEAHQQLRRAIQGEVREYRAIVITKTGKYKQVMIQHIPVFVDGILQSMYSTVRDMTSYMATLDKIQAFFIDSTYAMEILDTNGHILQVNPAYERLFGRKQEEVKGRFLPHIPKGKQDVIMLNLQQVKDGNTLVEMDMLAQKKDGSQVPVKVTLSPIRDLEGQIRMISGVIRDVSSQKETEQALKESKEKFHLLEEYTNDSVLIIRPDAGALYSSRRFEQEFGISTAMDIQSVRQILRTTIHPDDQPILDKTRKKVYTEKQVVCFECRRKDPEYGWIWLEVKAVPVLDDSGAIRYAIWSIQDIQERKNYETQLEQLAFHDFLTGVANRGFFETHVMQRIQSGEPFRLYHMDADYFKAINDQFSHEAGDLFLIEMVKRIRQVMQPTDFLARLGGDEFVIVGSEGTENEMRQFAAAVLQQFHTPFLYKGHSISSTLSIGIVHFPSHGDCLETLMKKADRALYYAKEHGRNQFSFYGAKHERDMLIESSLPRALSNGEMYLVYQPLMQLGTNRVYGIEALLRWNHPVLGEVSPVEFIPIAEKYNWIHDITLWVVYEATKQLQKWSPFGLRNAKLFVNFSPYLLNYTCLVDKLPRILQENGVDSGRLVLEITESGVIENLSKGLTILQKFKEAGIHIAMDDFGTGFSSLSYIRHLPISILKIDRSFIMQIDQQLKDSMIVGSIVELAKSLGLQVVAEGIETEQQECILTELGDVIGQGYHFSRPLSVEHITEWLRHKHETPMLNE